MDAQVKNLTIIGLGLIGASWALALKTFCPEVRVCGFDVKRQNLEKAQKWGIIDFWEDNLPSSVSLADIVIIASPLNKLVGLAQQALPSMKTGAILTDVGSIKGSLVETIEGFLPEGVSYVPGHPMAGSEKAGLEGADPYLFENAVYILTPTKRTPLDALSAVKKLLIHIGARPLLMDPYGHDVKVAAVSHFPHVLAATLINSVGALKSNHQDLFLLAGGGFKDTTRIAASQPEMWRDICLGNREAILDVLHGFESSLQLIKNALETRDGDELFRSFSEARALREQVPTGIKGILPELFEIVVSIPDQPGMIGKVAGFLGEKDLNIIDIEILRVREGDGGTMRLGFLEKGVALKAAELLKEKGFRLHIKF